MVRSSLMVGLIVVLIGLGVFLVSDTPLSAPTMTPPPGTTSSPLDSEGASFALTSTAYKEGRE